MSVLRDIAPNLVQRLRGEDAIRLRRVASTVCRFAVEESRLDSPIAARALKELGQSGTLAGATRDSLKDFADTLDERYLNLLRDYENNRADLSVVRKAFSQARTAAALVAASDDDPLVAATESIYEANVSIKEEGSVRKASLAPRLRVVIEEALAR